MPRISILLPSLILAAGCIQVEPIEPLPETHYAPTSTTEGDVTFSSTGSGTSDTGASATAATAIADDTGTTAAPPVTSDGSEGPCDVGTEACPCTPGGSCDPGLTCLSGFCVDVGCPIGSEGCACTQGGGCDPGLECLSMLCVDPDR